MILITLGLFIFTCLILVKSTEVLLESLGKIAAYLQVTEFVIGFIIMAFATSIPELSIGVSSALGSTPAQSLTSITLGNVVGANIINLTLVIGVAALLRKDIRIKTKAVRTDTIYMFLIAALPIILMMDREISRPDGIILLFVFCIYILRLLSQKKMYHDKGKAVVTREEFRKNLLYFAVSIVLLFISANMVVGYTTDIANSLGVPKILLGVFLLSLGTTLPELTFGAKAIMSEHEYMALGDTIGSVIANSTLVLGLTAVIFPITTADFLVYLTSAFFMLTVAFLFMTFIEAERHILWQEGIGLVLLYVLFVIVELSIESFQLAQAA